jgi:hypothetical protein
MSEPPQARDLMQQTFYHVLTALVDRVEAIFTFG